MSKVKQKHTKQTAIDKPETKSTTKNTVLAVREHIQAAAEMLRPLAGDYERVAWMLDDTLVYLEQAGDKGTQSNWKKQTLETLEKLLEANNNS